MSYCYKSYLTIEDSRKNNARSDSDLKDIITMCQQSILPPAKINSLSDAIVTIMAHTTVHVGNQLLQGKQLYFLMCMTPSTS